MGGINLIGIFDVAEATVNAAFCAYLCYPNTHGDHPEQLPQAKILQMEGNTDERVPEHRKRWY